MLLLVLEQEQPSPKVGQRGERKDVWRGKGRGGGEKERRGGRCQERGSRSEEEKGGRQDIIHGSDISCCITIVHEGGIPMWVTH